MIALSFVPSILLAATGWWPPLLDDSARPRIHIETGMHMQGVDNIDIDGQEKFLISSSRDGTVRIWDFGRKTLLQTLWCANTWNQPIPIAISRDGRLIALVSNNRDGRVFLIERESGNVVRCIRAPDNVSRLVFDPTARFLAICAGQNAVLGNSVGPHPFDVTIIRLADYYQLPLENESDSVWDSDFDKSGRFVTCSSKRIRLCDADFDHVADIAPATNAEPRSVRFSKDGTQIAIGYLHADNIDVVGGNDLKWIKSLPITAENAACRVCWSRDGSYLYAVGASRTRIWQVNQTSSSQEFETPNLAVAPVDGGLAGGGSLRPALGIVKNNGEKMIFGRPHTIPFYQNPIAVSADGNTVQFTYGETTSSKATFDLKERRLSTSANTPETAVFMPDTDAQSIGLSDYQPEIGGGKIKGKQLKRFSPTICMAIAPGRKLFALGAFGGFAVYDVAGNVKATVPCPDVLTLNFTKDGRLIVAGHSDGCTITWHLVPWPETGDSWRHNDGSPNASDAVPHARWQRLGSLDTVWKIRLFTSGRSVNAMRSWRRPLSIARFLSCCSVSKRILQS